MTFPLKAKLPQPIRAIGVAEWKWWTEALLWVEHAVWRVAVLNLGLDDVWWISSNEGLTLHCSVVSQEIHMLSVLLYNAASSLTVAAELYRYWSKMTSWWGMFVELLLTVMMMIMLMTLVVMEIAVMVTASSSVVLMLVSMLHHVVSSCHFVNDGNCSTVVVTLPCNNGLMVVSSFAPFYIRQMNRVIFEASLTKKTCGVLTYDRAVADGELLMLW